MNLLGNTHFCVKKQKRKKLSSIAFVRVSGQEQLKTPQSPILIINALGLGTLYG